MDEYHYQANKLEVIITKKKKKFNFLSLSLIRGDSGESHRIS